MRCSVSSRLAYTQKKPSIILVVNTQQLTRTEHHSANTVLLTHRQFHAGAFTYDTIKMCKAGYITGTGVLAAGGEQGGNCFSSTF